MRLRARPSALVSLLGSLIALPVVLASISSNALAAVSLADAPAERAFVVSGVAPILDALSDMTLPVGTTADQALRATDGDGDPVTFVNSAGPPYMTVTTIDPGTGVASGNVHLAPGFADAGSATATITATDGALTSSRTFHITAQSVPAAPVLTQPADMTVNAGGVQSQSLFANDANRDPLGFYLVSGPSYVTVSTADAGGGASGSALGEIQVAPGYLDTGTVTATIGVSDGVLADEKSITITVLYANAPPVLTQPVTMSLRVNETLDQQLTASDPNGDPLTFSKGSGPAFMAVTTVDASAGIGNVRLTPGPTDAGPTVGQVRVTDGLLTDQKSFTIDVRINRPPFLFSVGSMSVRAGEGTYETVFANDPDGDAIAFSITNGPSYMTLENPSHYAGNWTVDVTLRPGLGDVGTSTATVRASDGMLYVEDSFGITVLPPNGPPVLQQPADMTVIAGEVIEQTVTATDPDGDYVYFNPITYPDYMHFSYASEYDSTTGFVSSLTIRLLPDAGDIGTTTATLAASDNFHTVQKSFQVTVLAGSFPVPCPVGTVAINPVAPEARPYDLQIADLNGDDALDMVVEQSDGTGSRVFLGSGDGMFSGTPLVLNSGDAYTGAVGDFNGDGEPDLAFARLDANTISIFLGDGVGGFGPRRDVPFGQPQYWIGAGDINGDGTVDLVISGAPGTVSILRGAGDATFGPPTAITSTDESAYTFRLADLNADGALDVVMPTYNNLQPSIAISIFLNDASGAFTRTDTSTKLAYASYVSTGDLDGDGALDVVASFPNEYYVSVYLGNNDGTLGVARKFADTNSPQRTVITDWNGDGHADLAIRNDSHNFSILLGDGLGAFAPREDFDDGYYDAGIAAADVNDDLKDDLVIGNQYPLTSSGYVHVALNHCAPDRDHPPVVHAPAVVTTGEGSAVSFTVTSNDPDGPAVSSLTANFTQLPLGNNAAFAVDPGNGGGTFTWTPAFDAARAAPYPVTFTASNVISGSATTKIAVKNTNRAPVANAGGPYAAFAGSAVSLNGAASSDPDGDALTYAWAFGDGATGNGASPTHTYAAVGAYGIALTVSDGTLSSIATTTARITAVLDARAFAAGGNRTIRLNSGKPQWCVNVEPVGGSYANFAVNLGTLVMKSSGTGIVDQIHAIGDKVSIAGDKDGNGIQEIEACFGKDDLRQLFSGLHGNSTVTVTIEGTLFAGGAFRATIEINVVAGGGQLAATVAPNPLNPDAVLTFVTQKPGPAKVELFDLRGRLVRRLVEETGLAAGYHDVRVDGRDDHGGRLASGVYYFRIQTGEGATMGQFTVLK